MGQKNVNALCHPEKEDQIRNLFTSVDSDGNGSLDKIEFLAVANTLFRSHEKFNLDITDYQDACSLCDFSNAIFQMINVKNDGKLTFEEFVTFFKEKRDKNDLDAGLHPVRYIMSDIKEAGHFAPMHENDTFQISGDHHLFIGFGWDTSGIVDISAVLTNHSGDKFVVSSVGELASTGIKYTHGYFTSHQGKKSTEDKGFKIDTEDIDHSWTHIYFIINVSNERHQAVFSKLHCRLEEAKVNKDLARYLIPTTFESCQTIFYSALVRSDGGWEFMAIGKKISTSKMHHPKRLHELYDHSKNFKS
jgi:stress response protein SCP2